MKPCPFCGKQPRIWQDETDGPGGPIPTDYVITCCVEMRDYDEKELIKRWNKRVKNESRNFRS